MLKNADSSVIRRVLLVDHDRDASVTLADLLTQNGHACVHVPTVAHAVDQLPRLSPQAIVLEWGHMSGTNEQAIATLRAAAASCGLSPRIIVLSATLEPGSSQQSADAYLRKPASFRVIEDAIVGRSI